MFCWWATQFGQDRAVQPTHRIESAGCELPRYYSRSFDRAPGEVAEVDLGFSRHLFPNPSRRRSGGRGHFDTSLADPDVQHVLCIVDATRLEKSLFFCLQAVEACQRQGRPISVVANMGDILKRHGLSIDAAGLSRAIGAPVLVASARTGEGLDAVVSGLQSPPDTTAPSNAADDNPILASEGGAADNELYAEAHRLAEQYGAPADEMLQAQSRLDRFFLGSLSGGLIFSLIMLILFQSIFTWSAPAMDAVEAGSSVWVAGSCR